MNALHYCKQMHVEILSARMVVPVAQNMAHQNVIARKTITETDVKKVSN